MVRVALLTLAVALAFSATSTAREIYSYEDENGVLVFTDRKQDLPGSVDTIEIKDPKDARRVRLETKKGSTGAEIIATNDFFSPASVTLEFLALDNLMPDKDEHQVFVIPARSQVSLLKLNWLERASWHLEYSYQYSPGVVNPDYDTQFPYQLPFSFPKQLRISQAFFGAFSHHQPHTEYAVDIPMPEGTPILAARVGTVVEVISDNEGASTDLTDNKRANVVRIAHLDGAMTVYAHLKRNSIQVRVGESVHQGRKIAESGNTGFSSGPHLHFAVQVNQSGELTSVPFLFNTLKGAVVPEAGLIISSTTGLAQP